uniref:NADH-ubiquinone oxidoreductase chain 4L n=1 Tax=Pseudorhaetus sinicus TaxID=618541 RepID=A0A8F9WL92_9SCAR|nr:NADH dehydrogenase subunit 4L [Pseudorhaetus sinicus]QYK91431.1 NADH dehydrogenase subunit 4L [Pseudorhaetus sinicus]UFK32132.1 NADH dehydrogenase subunit 4L [Pseudorhaetus sinicus]UGY85198.1 NADH dehydrogenase subunit 4L [Pseudorhaetus sinicus]
MEILIMMFVFMYLMGMLSFCLNRQHMLLMLLSLEFVVVSLFLGLYVHLCVFGWEFYFLMVYLTISVCEGALGLSILVLLMRTYGNDYMESFSLLW